jgi:hypothetical protein
MKSSSQCSGITALKVEVCYLPTPSGDGQTAGVLMLLQLLLLQLLLLLM